jgi:putative heme degradation protein
MDNSTDPDLEALQLKTERNEMRARDAEARLRIIEAEIALIHKRKELMDLRDAGYE